MTSRLLVVLDGIGVLMSPLFFSPTIVPVGGGSAGGRAVSAPAGEPLLVYDGDCGFCQRSIDLGRRWLRWWPRTVPYQRLDLGVAGLSAEQVRTAAWWIYPDGRAESGHLAAAALFAAQPQRGWRLAGLALRHPPLNWLGAVVYRTVAANRHRLPGGTAACAENQAGPPAR